MATHNVDLAQVQSKLTLKAYQDLEAAVSQPRVSDNTSDISAGFKLGVEHVLQYIRRNLVSGL
ncbi:hypothetical protein FDH29_gp33 [Aquamicrobium phage P14]|uniref:Uncharacterized protein n=1 Tax=Aquamicrobium phage P14 TaxID=1927013 RepID=A0A1L5C086_9CAUD|nr:hypothetical protein FDH29_gp33 [Aquamicrobium phage P14]APL99491.1 hypothetical protein BB738_0330 [Aquamicrobium phage P14]